jgi:hypothetical protein
LSLASGFNPAWVGEWMTASGAVPDTNGGLFLRTVDGSKIYPRDVDDEVHDDGEIWSAMLWYVYSNVPDSQKDNFVTIVLQSHMLVPDAPTFNEGGHALVDANALVIYNGLDARPLIRQSLLQRGIFQHSPPKSVAVSTSTEGNTITWKNTSDVAGSVQIWRGEGNDAPTPLNTVSTSTTTYLDAQVGPKKSYTYLVKAVNIDDASNLASSAPVTVTTSADANPNTGVPQPFGEGTPEGAPIEHKASGGCFIATAAYGTSMEAHVVSLRAFRDHVLLGSAPGRWLVATYYRLSPPIADWISTRPWARCAVRLMLGPVVAAVENPALALAMSLLAAMLALRAVRLRRRARVA